MATRSSSRPRKGRPETWTWNRPHWLRERWRMLVHRVLSLDAGLVLFSAVLAWKTALANPPRPRDVLLFVLAIYVISQLNLTSRWLLPKLAERVVEWKTGKPAAPAAGGPG